MPYGAMSDPIASIDNGDGTFTFNFDDGRQPLTAAGPIARKKHDEIQMSAPVDINPALTASVQPGEDQRTALVEGVGIGGNGGRGEPPPSVPDTGAPRMGVSVPPEESPALKPGAANQPGASIGDTTPNFTAPPGSKLEPEGIAKIDPSKLQFQQSGSGGMGGIPGVYVPGTKGGWQATSKVERPGYQASEGVQTARQAAQGLEANAGEAQYQAQQQKSQYEIGAAAARADAIGKQLAEDTQRMSQQQNQLVAKRAELDRLGDEVANKKINPNELLEGNGGFNRIGMAIAAFAGAMGGGAETVMGVINKQIDRNIQGQAANINNAKDALAAKRQGYKDLEQSFASANEQEAARRNLAWRAAEAELDAQKAKLGPAFDDASYEQMKAAMAEKRAASMAAFEKEAMTETQISSRNVPARKGGIVQAAPSKFEHGRYVPQFGGLAPTEEEAKKARAAGQLNQEVDALVEENVTLRKDPQAFVPGTDANARLKSNQAKLALRIKSPEGEQLGVLAGPDMGLIESAIGKGDSVLPGQTAAMQSYRANLHRRNAQMRQNLGILPVQVAPYMNPKTGQIEMGQYHTGGPTSPVAAPNLTPRGE